MNERLNNLPDVLNTAEIAHIMNCPINSIERAIRYADGLKATKHGRHYLINKTDFILWLEKMKIQPTNFYQYINPYTKG